VTSKLAFNFHGVVGFEVETADSNAIAFFAAEYEYASGEPSNDAPLVRLHWQHCPTPLLPRAGYRLHVHKVFARWRYQIAITEQEVTIRCVGNRFAIPMVHHMLVHPSLRYLASLRGVLLLHSAAVVHKGRSFILTGHGGVGKTTTSSLLLESGGGAWHLHADDYVFIGDGPITYAYVTRSHLYRDSLRWFPQMRHRLTPGERLHLGLFGRLRSWTGERIQWPLRLSASRLWPTHHISPQATPAALILLERSAEKEPKLVPLAGDEIPVDDLIAMNFYEARYFCHLVELAGQPETSGLLAAWKQREHNLLRVYAKAIPAYRLLLPGKNFADPQMGKDMLQLLEPILVDSKDGKHNG
jgi:hypothetical protein